MLTIYNKRMVSGEMKKGEARPSMNTLDDPNHHLSRIPILVLHAYCTAWRSQKKEIHAVEGAAYIPAPLRLHSMSECRKRKLRNLQYTRSSLHWALESLIQIKYYTWDLATKHSSIHVNQTYFPHPLSVISRSTNDETPPMFAVFLSLGISMIKYSWSWFLSQ